MKRKIIGFLLILLMLASVAYGQNTLSKRLLGKEDVNWATGGTGVAETFTYVTPTGYTLTLTKPDASHLKFRTVAYSLDALVDGSNTIDAKLKTLTVSSTSTFTGVATFSAFPVTPSSAPVSNYQVPNKKYVDDQIAAQVVNITPANIQGQSYTAVAAGGTADVITATYSPAIGALTDKLRVTVIAGAANATTTPTFSPNGLTAKTIVKGSNQALVAGDIPGAYFPADLEYDATLTKWILLNPAYAVSTTGTTTGRTVQEVYTLLSTVQTGTTTIPFDDTIPQNTEGDQYITRAITPTSATNLLRIDVTVFLSHSNSTRPAAALFQDTTAGALAVGICNTGSSGNLGNIKFTYWMVAGTTSATTFKVRCGSNAAGTTTVNGEGGARKYGGVLTSSITITEYKV